MARALTASRATVSRQQEAEYLATLARLAARMTARGEHLWLFRNPEAAGSFLEFSESADPGRHRAVRVMDPEESELERRLEAIASYAPEARVLWEEVSLEGR